MTYEPAPIYDVESQGPEGVAAHWIHTEDGLRLRAAGWKAGTRGTVVIFNGLSEFIEKYGRVAKDMAEAGYATASVDWRSQGMSDRLKEDPLLGYIESFPDFQKDVAALCTYLEDMDYPKPWHLLGHSMGSMIALRTLQSEHPFTSVTFSAPMWTIKFAPLPTPVATTIAAAAVSIGYEDRYVPGTGPESYTSKTPFAETRLTGDEETYAWMQKLYRLDGVRRGGPTFKWLNEAAAEIRIQSKAPAPNVPALLALGDDDPVVENDVALETARRWGLGNVLILSPCKHEPMMERPGPRGTFIREMLRHMAMAEAASA